jgi:hypothetical protein
VKTGQKRRLSLHFAAAQGTLDQLQRPFPDAGGFGLLPASCPSTRGALRPFGGAWGTENGGRGRRGNQGYGPDFEQVNHPNASSARRGLAGEQKEIEKGQAVPQCMQTH